MILTEAKRRAKTEFEEALRKSGLTNTRPSGKSKDTHPELNCATYRIPHGSYVGNAANYVEHLAKGKGLGRP